MKGRLSQLFATSVQESSVVERKNGLVTSVIYCIGNELCWKLVLLMNRLEILLSSARLVRFSLTMKMSSLHIGRVKSISGRWRKIGTIHIVKYARSSSTVLLNCKSIAKGKSIEKRLRD